MAERCRVRLTASSEQFRSFGGLFGRPNSAVVSDEAPFLIDANAEYAATPIGQIHQCCRVVTESPPSRAYEAEVDTPIRHILLAFPTEQEFDTLVCAVWAVVLARYLGLALSR